jgi:two-component system, chemotaxis family, sensor histidine kinase and response regulator PixL
MYIDPELRDRVYQVFSLEVFKMLQTIETELVTFSLVDGVDPGQRRNAAKVHNLLRAAHSIKGCAASLGFGEIENLAHQLEDIFRVLDRPELPFDRELELLLFDLYDRLHRLVTAQIKGQTLAPDFHRSTQAILTVLEDRIGHFVKAGRQSPEDPLCNANLIKSIFEVDVAASLARLQDIFADPAYGQIAIGEFRAQAEVFTGIAEMTNILSFGTIAHSTIAALDFHPDRARDICCFALVHFYAALDAILHDDLATCQALATDFAGLMAENPLNISQGETGEPGGWVTGGFKSFTAALPIAGDTDAEAEYDFQIADLLLMPPIFEAFSPDFDLADIFDLANLESEHPNIFEAFSPDFDLADIFDLANLESEHPNIFDTFSPDFDLADIFDLPRSERRNSIAVFLPDLHDADDDLSFDLVDIFDLARSPHPELSIDSPHRKIREMAAEIASNFDRFTPIVPTTFAPPTKSFKPVRVKKSRQIAANQTPQLSVRVTLDRLERMNNLIGELAIERNGLALSNEQSTDTLQRLRSKCANFQTIGDKLQQIAETLAISTPAAPATTDTTRLDPHSDLERQFDVLELDRYSEFHHIAQATIEQLAQIEEQIEDLSLFVTESAQQIDRQKQHISHLRDDLMWARMLPLSEILNRFPRTLHDLSIEFNKPVDLKITGAGVLVDRAVIDKLLDPLVHLLRNAFDHGIDLPAARQAMNKPERGSISITAYHQGSQTVIEIADDGRGIDVEKIQAKAIALQLLTPLAATTATTAELFDLLFIPGFSTADRVTKLSGRGMGLDIVKAQLQSIKGTISIDSKFGQGTTFTLRIPLTLTIAQLMVCQVGNALYAFPAGSIQKIVVPTPAQLTQQDSQRLFHWLNLIIPIYRLADLLTYSIPVPERTISHTLQSSATNPDDWLPPLLLIRNGDKIIALEIDKLITERELTIKPFGKAITPPSYSYGCTILGDGSILPVLDPHTLIQVLIERPHSTETPSLPMIPVIEVSNSILVIDDSITTRQSLCLTLEKFGYRTLEAKDGQEALQILRQKTSELKLVVCDVEMPNMNGFEFLNVYRQDPTLTHIPVVMLTSRSNPKHRQFAAHLGAVDYFIKPYVEQDFISAIEKIIS